MEQTIPAQAGEVANLSLWHLIMQASWPVFLVMLGLALASVWCWAIILEKWFAFRRENAANDKFEQAFWSGQSLDDLYHGARARDPVGMASVFVAAMEEWKRSQGAAMRAGFAGVLKRIEKVMDVQIQKEMGDLEARLLFLATIGSAAPFIGLFGTVYGIMVSFQGIATSGNTSLAVVAPGIAEALFATAIGLVAAIPATIFYNMYASDASKVATRLENFADEFSAIISRQLDEKVLTPMGASVGSTGGGTRRGRRGNRKGLNADINVTPLVDVMLVLLIVFMVAAPLMTVSVPVDLPKASAKPTPAPVEPTFITVQADKTVFLGEQKMPMDQLLAQLEAVAKDGKNENLMVRADKALTYGHVIEVLGLLNGAGYTKVGLATLPLDNLTNN